MQLHGLQPSNPRKKKKRIGRGGKRGTYSGRGIKGQKSRSGHRIRPAERDLLIRLPKLRGFRNKSLVGKAISVNVDQLGKLEEPVISRAVLTKHGFIAKNDSRPVKILANGEITRAIKVEGLRASASAKLKIEKAGGSVS